MTAAGGDQTRAGRLVAGTAAPVPAATVLLLRPGAGGGIEVFLQERTLASDFAGGAYVFPGGKVDERDAAMDPELLGPIDGAGLERAIGPGAVPLAVAAVREAFEEAGVLLATRAGHHPTADDLASPPFVAARAGLAERGRDHDWRPFLAEQGLVLDLAALAPFAWWITPHGVHRRFSARFFLAAVPSEQLAALGHDGDEMTDSVWLSPQDALAAADAGRRTIIFPTRRTLATLAELADVDAALAAARAGRVDLRPILPLLRRHGEATGVQHPDGGPIEVV